MEVHFLYQTRLFEGESMADQLQFTRRQILHLLSTGAAGTFLAACAPQLTYQNQNEGDSVMATQDNRAIYQRFVAEVLNKGNVAAADQFFATEFVDHSLPPNMPGTVAGFKEWFSAFLAAFPDQQWTIDVILAEGDLVAHQKTVRATHTGEFFGTAPTGKKIETSEIGIIKFKDGKMVEFWGLFDEAKMMQQLGAAPAPPG